ncbi:MAG: 6-carboxytetrahydropterin synthase QueD [Thermodesulfobacteriota bacterium]
MFEIFVTASFAAGHHLRNYPGNCEHPHGHNWEVRVAVLAHSLDDLGMAVDFRTVKAALGQVLADLDHRNLNDHPAFTHRNPSSENLAVHIYQGLLPLLAGERYRLASVTVSETPSSGVTFRAD